MTHTHFYLLLQSGTVIDGTKRLRFVADVDVLNGGVVAVGDLSTATANTTLDATGLSVAPRFIDADTHDDQTVLAQPGMSFKIEVAP